MRHKAVFLGGRLLCRAILGRTSQSAQSTRSLSASSARPERAIHPYERVFVLEDYPYLCTERGRSSPPAPHASSNPVTPDGHAAAFLSCYSGCRPTQVSREPRAGRRAGAVTQGLK